MCSEAAEMSRFGYDLTSYFRSSPNTRHEDWNVGFGLRIRPLYLRLRTF
jgi:hypothetical protein